MLTLTPLPEEWNCAELDKLWIMSPELQYNSITVTEKAPGSLIRLHVNA